MRDEGGRKTRSVFFHPSSLIPLKDPRMDPAVPPLSPAQARAFWYGLINYEQRVPVVADLKLERMRELLGRLGNPHQRVPILHLAGTKGKGSTAAMLAAILRQAGYRTGLFTSPNLVHVEERFQIDGVPISTAELTRLLNDIWLASRQAGGQEAAPALAGLTFFEVATAIGFLHFARLCDVVVLEVGLGGRFDSTNVCEPEVALITSISYDHTRILGDRLASIAFEKAGIVKPGRPVVSGATAPEALPVIETVCHDRGAPLRRLDADFRYAYQPGRVSPTGTILPRVQITTWRRTWPSLALNLFGEHQAANAAVALACIEILVEAGWQVSESAVTAGLATVTWPARLEVVGLRPLTVLDCAHNVASADAVVETLRTTFPPTRRVLLFAGSSDKDLAGMFRVLAPHFAHAVLTRYTTNPRAVPPEQLDDLWQSAGGGPSTLAPDPRTALEKARSLAGPDDLICATGSVFLAGELRPLFVPEPTDGAVGASPTP
jgi:dihydrofolate synthase / folylpolyglutamate synthase